MWLSKPSFLVLLLKQIWLRRLGSSACAATLIFSKRLSNHQRTQAHQHSDFICVQKEKDDLTQKLKDEFGSIKNGSKFSNGIQHTRIQSKLRTLKLRVEREAFTKILRDFNSAAGRRQLAHNLFQSATEFSFVKMVDAMTRLCSLYEGKDQRCSSYEGNMADQTNNAYTCTQLFLSYSWQARTKLWFRWSYLKYLTTSTLSKRLDLWKTAKVY